MKINNTLQRSKEDIRDGICSIKVTIYLYTSILDRAGRGVQLKDMGEGGPRNTSWESLFSWTGFVLRSP